MPTAARPRRTQEERTAATRRRLLDATVECLVEHGYHGTTTTRVVDRAGVSRGAQVHHFPTKNALVLAAVEHLARKRADQIVEQHLDRLRASPDAVGDALDLVWEVHQGPLFEASMELWTAARTDPDLREHVADLERLVTGGILELSRALLGDRADDPGFRGDVYLVLETVRGLRLLQFIHPTTPERSRERWLRSRERLRPMIARWSEAVAGPAPGLSGGGAPGPTG
ncbi:TetR/AcrR family transcriptional regulator [Actinomadura parmotrematis]|uniref:TetR/AcrR family transcriptional regulator n=1 Tax=Actinomadura parmotrematis TaxID=2864039 RepID=A0ABS7FRH5_9ACTN|nr:TetR/AcrR family transcriptional regulator [Actinomadura parmotrematis]MBW8483003.1 TetR/AcrR family transcriptional regulator [Actinomadura parmotrematis]